MSKVNGIFDGKYKSINARLLREEHMSETLLLCGNGRCAANASNEAMVQILILNELAPCSANKTYIKYYARLLAA